jgi:hypothetical protein
LYLSGANSNEYELMWVSLWMNIGNLKNVCSQWMNKSWDFPMPSSLEKQ